MLLNFLIAVISQVYDDVVDKQGTLKYVHRAQLNREYFMIQSFISTNKEFKFIVFSIDKEAFETDEETFTGFVQQVKLHINKQQATLKKKL
jgi:hypothetical protein